MFSTFPKGLQDSLVSLLILRFLAPHNVLSFAWKAEILN